MAEKGAGLEIRVRPARPLDKPAVLGICKHTWHGWDYVPLFYDEWVRQGGFWVAELGHRVIGLGKATELAKGELWLEGLRVDPRFRKRGIGSDISRQIVRLALGLRPVSLRLATAEVNAASVKIIERAGFKLHFRTRLYSGRPRKPKSGPTPVVPSTTEAMRFFDRSSELEANRGLLGHTWIFRRSSPSFTRELIRAGAMYGDVGRRSELDGLVVVRPHRYFERDLDISYLGGSERAVKSLAGFVFWTAAERGSKRISGMAASDDMRQAFGRLGLKPEPGIGDILVYDYPV